MKIESSLADSSKPKRIIVGKDEMNLAEFPVCALAHRLSPGVKTLRFEDRVWDDARGDYVTRRVTVTGSDEHGLPTEKDEEVLLGLIQITRQRGFSDRRVIFTRCELIHTLGWRDDSKSYARIKKALNRWHDVSVHYDNAWRDKRNAVWVSPKFHYIDNVWLCHRGEKWSDFHLSDNATPASAFVWNEVIFRSFTDGNIKSIDYEFYKSLKSAVAKRLYRFLDKKFWHSPRRDFDLRRLCCEHIGLSRNYDTANLKRKLMSGIEELEERRFLRTCPTTQRFTKLRRGEWTVSVEKNTCSATGQEGHIEVEGDSTTQALIERGMSLFGAARIVREFSHQRIWRQIEHFDWLCARKTQKVFRNPAGFLFSLIQSPYQPDDLPKQKIRAMTANTRSPESNVATKAIPSDDAEDELTRSLIDRFWQLIPDHERSALEATVIANASQLHRNIIEGGGAGAEPTRKWLLDAFALSNARLQTS